MAKLTKFWMKLRRSFMKNIHSSHKLKSILSQSRRSSRKKRDGRSSQNPKLWKDRKEKGFEPKLRSKKPRKPVLLSHSWCQQAQRVEEVQQPEADMTLYLYLKDFFTKLIWKRRSERDWRESWKMSRWETALSNLKFSLHIILTPILPCLSSIWTSSETETLFTIEWGNCKNRKTRNCKS